MTGSSRATYQTIPGLDAAIVNALPDQGQRLGYHPLAPQTAAIVKKLNADLTDGAPPLTGTSVGSRLQVLRHLGYVVDLQVQPMNKGRGWQATPEGREWAAREEAMA